MVYTVICWGGEEAFWLNDLLEDLGIELPTLLFICGDSQGVTVRVSGEWMIHNLSSSLVSNPGVITSTPRMNLEISDEIEMDLLFEWWRMRTPPVKSAIGQISFYGNAKYILGYGSSDLKSIYLVERYRDGMCRASRVV